MADSILHGQIFLTLSSVMLGETSIVSAAPDSTTGAHDGSRVLVWYVGLLLPLAAYFAHHKTHRMAVFADGG